MAGWNMGVSIKMEHPEKKRMFIVFDGKSHQSKRMIWRYPPQETSIWWVFCFHRCFSSLKCCPRGPLGHWWPVRRAWLKLKSTPSEHMTDQQAPTHWQVPNISKWEHETIYKWVAKRMWTTVSDLEVVFLLNEPFSHICQTCFIKGGAPSESSWYYHLQI